MKSKTIILSSQKKFITNSPRAIVTFISDNSKVEGKLRLYNLSDLPPASKLGIYYNEQVYTVNLVKKDGAFSFYVDENINLDNNIYCAIIDRANKNDVVLCGGTSNGFVISSEENEEDDEGDLEDLETKQLVENEIRKDETSQDCENCKSCENCTYKEYFYAHHKKDDEKISEVNKNDKETCEKNEVVDETSKVNKVVEENNANINNISNEQKDLEDVLNKDEIVLVDTSDEEPFNQKIETVFEDNKKNEEFEDNTVSTQNSESEKFLKQITEQLDDMFKNYPEDNTIMQIIPNSKVIKVTDSIDESSYIVGVIYESGEINYLLYGVPAKYNDTPPKELGENYQWLPLNVDDPMSDGYYLIYQDATSGKIVPIKVE